MKPLAEVRSYGDILRNERELSGYDLASIANRLHIRPDILAAIEDADFDRMPARGYSKNMVRAYARLLKLDEHMITEMYLEEINDYELGYLDDAPSYSRGFRNASRPLRNSSQPIQNDRRDKSRRKASASGRGRASSGRQDDLPSRSRGSRSSYEPDSRQPSQGRANSSRRKNSNRDARRGRNDAPRRQDGRERSNDRNRRSLQGPVSGMGSMLSSIGRSQPRQDGRVPRTVHTIGSTPPYARNNQQRNPSAFGNMNLTMLLGLVALVIIVIIVVVIFVNSGQKANEEVPSIPISGLTDTSSPEDNNQVSNIDIAPQDAQMQYSVADGQSAWIEIYENGAEDPKFSEVVNGPASETFTVTGTLRILTANPDGVTVTVDGNPVTLTKDDDSNYYSYTVDFPAILRAWKEEHPASSSSAASSASSASSSAASGAKGN